MLKNFEKDNLSSSTLQQVELQSSMSPSTIVDILEEESTNKKKVLTQEISLQTDSIATNRPQWVIRKHVWYTNIVAYALPVTNDVPFTFLEAMQCT